MDLTRSRANIDYPQEEEVIVSERYSVRITAPLNAEKVEVCIDGAPWLLCRYSAGFWWYDWSDYQIGEHEIVARILPFDSRNYILRTRRFLVSSEKSHGPDVSLVDALRKNVIIEAISWRMSNVRAPELRSAIDALTEASPNG